MVITKDDGAMFFYGYWIIEALLALVLSKHLKILFKKKSLLFGLAFSITSCALFTVFAIVTFPRYSSFPDRTIGNIMDGEKKVLAKVLEAATNKSISPNYLFDRMRIETAFRIFSDTISRREYSSDYMLYEYFLGIPGERPSMISVDTILYNNSFNRLLVKILYRSTTNTYSAHGFIGYWLPNKNNTLALYPLERVLFPYTADKEGLIRQLRTAYFIRIRNYEFDGKKVTYSPLDTGFWTGPIFTKQSLVDSLYPFEFERRYDDNKCQILRLPSLLVP